MLGTLASDDFTQYWRHSPHMIGAAFLRIAAFVAIQVCLLLGAHVLNGAAGAVQIAPFAAPAAAYLAPFAVPLAIAWFMPGWRWLLAYVLLVIFVFLVGMALSGAPGGGEITRSMYRVAVASGAGAGFLAGVIGRGVGLALLEAGRSLWAAWSAQIATAAVLGGAVALAPLALAAI